MASTRRLAAILAADVAGYSRLMGADEEGTHQRLKDRHPFPMSITVYDRTIRVPKSAVAKARLGREEELAALKRLDDQARLLESYVTGPALPQVLDQDWQNSHANGGRSIFGWEPPPKRIHLG